MILYSISVKVMGKRSSNGGCTFGEASHVTDQVLDQGSNLTMNFQEDPPTNCLEASSKGAVQDLDCDAIDLDKQLESPPIVQAPIGEESQFLSSDGMKATIIPDNITRDGDSLPLDQSVPPGNFCFLRLFRHGQLWFEPVAPLVRPFAF